MQPVDAGDVVVRQAVVDAAAVTALAFGRGALQRTKLCGGPSVRRWVDVASRGYGGMIVQKVGPQRPRRCHVEEVISS